VKDYALAAAIAGAAILIAVFGILMADANRNLLDRQQADIHQLRNDLQITRIELIKLREAEDHG
jgi:hypothetical protein